MATIAATAMILSCMRLGERERGTTPTTATAIARVNNRSMRYKVEIYLLISALFYELWTNARSWLRVLGKGFTRIRCLYPDVSSYFYFRLNDSFRGEKLEEK